MSNGGEEMPACPSLAAVPRVPDPGLCFLRLIGRGFSGLSQPALLPAPTASGPLPARKQAGERPAGQITAFRGFSSVPARAC